MRHKIGTESLENEQAINEIIPATLCWVLTLLGTILYVHFVTESSRKSRCCYVSCEVGNYPYFMVEKTEAQRASVCCLRPHSNFLCDQDLTRHVPDLHWGYSLAPAI